MLTSLETPAFVIQERFTSSESSGRQVTVSTGVVIQDEYVPTVEISIPKKTDNVLNWVNNCPIDLYVAGTARYFNEDYGPEVQVSLSGTTMHIRHKATGLDLSAIAHVSTTFGCYFNVQVVFPPDY